MHHQKRVIIMQKMTLETDYESSNVSKIQSIDIGEERGFKIKGRTGKGGGGARLATGARRGLHQCYKQWKT